MDIIDAPCVVVHIWKLHEPRTIAAGGCGAMIIIGRKQEKMGLTPYGMTGRRNGKIEQKNLTPGLIVNQFGEKYWLKPIGFRRKQLGGLIKHSDIFRSDGPSIIQVRFLDVHITPSPQWWKA